MNDASYASRMAASELPDDDREEVTKHPKKCPCEDCRHPGWARDVTILGGDPSL